MTQKGGMDMAILLAGKRGTKAGHGPPKQKAARRGPPESMPRGGPDYFTALRRWARRERFRLAVALGITPLLAALSRAELTLR